jgi:hypothetical protein
MAISRCPNPECRSSSFELVEDKHVRNANYTLFLIQCSGCGTVIGVIGSGDVLTHLHAQSNALKAIAGALNVDVRL